MNKTNLVEVKKDEAGTGLLIEHDGYISSDCGENKKLFEDINTGKNDGFYCPSPFIVSAVFQKYGVKNANGRIYPEDILKREVEKYQEKIRKRKAIGECNHPSEAVIDLSRTAMNITELHWEGKTLVGQLEVLISEGFRKYGIISCCGDEVANLLLKGIEIGVSSRGLGSVTQQMGTLMVSSDFELVCWDFVSDNSTPGALVKMDREDLQPYIESVDRSAEDKSKLLESLTQFDNWLND